MLRSVEILAVLTGVAQGGERFHNVHFLPTAEFSLDCFICQRTRRTTIFNVGAEQALCTSDDVHGRHPAAARIATFATTTEADAQTLRVVIDYWWAPFHDAKRDVEASALSTHPWVRVHFGSYCPLRNEAGKHSTQSNLIRPCSTHCGHCDATIAASDEAPRIRILD